MGPGVRAWAEVRGERRTRCWAALGSRAVSLVGHRQGVHVLGDVVNVGDVRPLLRVWVDTHVY